MIALVLLIAAAIAAVTFLDERWGPSQATLERRYARRTSRFITVAGTTFHYLDEGCAEGSVVVLSSAQWASVSQWDDWVPVLADRYRVVRIDLPGHGLTGAIPSGDYSFENYEQLLIAALDAIGIDRFALIGTSFSGTIAFRYAARDDRRLWALVLANASGLPRAPGGKGPNEPPPHWLHRVCLPYYRLRGFMKAKLHTLVLNTARVTPGLVRELTDMNNRRGRLKEAQARAAAYKVGDPAAVLAKVRVPTLVLASTGSTYLGASDADRFCALLTNAPTQAITFPGLGHLIAIDGGARVARDVRAFLDQHAP